MKVEVASVKHWAGLHDASMAASGCCAPLRVAAAALHSTAVKFQKNAIRDARINRVVKAQHKLSLPFSHETDIYTVKDIAAEPLASG